MENVAANPDVKKFIVYELESNKRIGVSWVRDIEIIGRFTSNQFTLMNGHMYFSNQVYKFRYDTMIETKSDFIS
jgi:hypothetical protein